MRNINDVIAANRSARSQASKLVTGDDKYDMYINALPASVRKAVHAQEPSMEDVRRLYQIYRKVGRQAFLEMLASE